MSGQATGLSEWMACKTQDSLCSNDKMLHGILAEPGSLNSKHLALGAETTRPGL